MKRLSLIATVVSACALPLAFACAPAAAQTMSASGSSANALSDTDSHFVQGAGTAGATEIAASKLARTRSSDKDVKAFARRMVIDHTKLARQVKAAAPHGTTVPDTPDASLMDSLKPLKGAAFDSAYIQKVGVAGHKDAVALFQDEAANGQNASLKSAAQKALPTIEHHYQMAQDLAKKKGVPLQ